jgi:hypothetical protein
VFYFLKLSSISCAISFPQSQNASHPAIASIDINQMSIVFVISVAIPILLSTTIRVKKRIIIFAQEAIILAVFCLVRSSAW